MIDLLVIIITYLFLYDVLYCFIIDTRVVGPFLPSPAKPLPKELEEFIGKDGDEDVILVSFGSILGEIAELNEPLLQRMADAFSKLPQKVIWKMKLEGMFINTPRNILIQARKSNYSDQRIN